MTTSTRIVKSLMHLHSARASLYHGLTHSGHIKVSSAMQRCPHCQQEGITNLQKVFSASFAPAECSLCHEKSYIHVFYGLFALAAWIVITWVFIGLSYMARSSFFLLGTFPALVVVVNKCLLGAPLRAIYRP